MVIRLNKPGLDDNYSSWFYLQQDGTYAAVNYKDGKGLPSLNQAVIFLLNAG